jgi:hypothetical protein
MHLFNHLLFTLYTGTTIEKSGCLLHCARRERLWTAES